MREWNRRGLVTAQGGKPFGRQSVLVVMRNPRNAGLAVLPGRDGKRHGERPGTAQWEAILPEETWRAVDALLADPAASRRRACGRCSAGWPRARAGT